MIGGAYPLAFLTFCAKNPDSRRSKESAERASVTFPKLGDDDVARLFGSVE
jgi:hypothetical protein